MSTAVPFSQINYERIPLAAIEARFEEQLAAFQRASTWQEQDEAMLRIQEIRQEVESAREISHIRHTIDTTDS